MKEVFTLLPTRQWVPVMISDNNYSFLRLTLHSSTVPHLQPSVKLSSHEISGPVSNPGLNTASIIVAVMPLYILIQRKT
jgi:hypothetical protein